MDTALAVIIPDADTAAVKAESLPAHSPLGASSAERWMNCPGSVSLIGLLYSNGEADEEEPDYRRDGTQAHSLLEHCLNDEIDCWEADEDKFPELTKDMMDAVQEALDYIRAQPGDRLVESRVYLPDFHPQFYGTLDCIVVDTDAIHVIDYKHGVGVVVDAEENPQLKYYAFGFLSTVAFSKSTLVKLTIVQPRGFHPAGPIRTWTTTVGEIVEWAEEVLHPAMEATRDEEYLDVGSWCRFCPAKVICPAMQGLARRALAMPDRVSYPEAQQLKMLIKAVEERTYTALMDGKVVEGAKLVRGRSNRIFKDGAEEKLVALWGEGAYERKLKSPAQLEKIFFGGKDFCAEWAYTPDGGLTVALDSDKRRAVKPQSLEQKYGDPSQYTA